jgi:hypothetical protein
MLAAKVLIGMKVRGTSHIVRAMNTGNAVMLDFYSLKGCYACQAGITFWVS